MYPDFVRHLFFPNLLIGLLYLTIGECQAINLPYGVSELNLAKGENKDAIFYRRLTPDSDELISDSTTRDHMIAYAKIQTSNVLQPDKIIVNEVPKLLGCKRISFKPKDKSKITYSSLDHLSDEFVDCETLDGTIYYGTVSTNPYYYLIQAFTNNLDHSKKYRLEQYILDSMDELCSQDCVMKSTNLFVTPSKEYISLPSYGSVFSVKSYVAKTYVSNDNDKFFTYQIFSPYAASPYQRVVNKALQSWCMNYENKHNIKSSADGSVISFGNCVRHFFFRDNVVAGKFHLTPEYILVEMYNSSMDRDEIKFFEKEINSIVNTFDANDYKNASND